MRNDAALGTARPRSCGSALRLHWLVAPPRGSAAGPGQVRRRRPDHRRQRATGAQCKNGADQAAADINAAGGILGQKLIVSTATTSPIRSKASRSPIISSADGVKFVIGHYNSGVTIPASDVYLENGILEITPASTNPTVTERGMWNVFRVCGRDDQQGGVAGDYIAKHFKGKNIAIVNDKTTYGKGLADETQEGDQRPAA